MISATYQFPFSTRFARELSGIDGLITSSTAKILDTDPETVVPNICSRASGVRP